MAQLNTRGTVTRSRWDFFESSDGFAFIYGSTPAGGIGAYLANNSTGAADLDIFNFSWSASFNTVWEVAFLVPPLVLNPLPPAESFIHPLAPNNAQPPGVVGMYTTNAGVYWTIKRYSAGSSGENLAPIMGSYFCTLPPGWAITIGGNSPSAPVELSMTVWYQEVTDNMSPAR